MRKRLENVTSVNDEARRCAKLVKELNSFGPRNEKEKQQLNKTVHHVKKKIKTITQSGMASEVSTN